MILIYLSRHATIGKKPSNIWLLLLRNQAYKPSFGIYLNTLVISPQHVAVLKFSFILLLLKDTKAKKGTLSSNEQLEKRIAISFVN